MRGEKYYILNFSALIQNFFNNWYVENSWHVGSMKHFSTTFAKYLKRLLIFRWVELRFFSKCERVGHNNCWIISKRRHKNFGSHQFFQKPVILGISKNERQLGNLLVVFIVWVEFRPFDIYEEKYARLRLFIPHAFCMKQILYCIKFSTTDLLFIVLYKASFVRY